MNYARNMFTPTMFSRRRVWVRVLFLSVFDFPVILTNNSEVNFTGFHTRIVLHVAKGSAHP